MLSTSRDVQYIWGVLYIGGISWVHCGDIMSTLGDVQYIGGIQWVHQGYINLIKPFQFLLKTPMYWTSPMYWLSADILMISPDVLMVSLWCTEYRLIYSWYPSDVLEHPPMYSCYPPDVLMVSPDVMNTPDVLNIPWCTEHILYRVNIFGAPKNVNKVWKDLFKLFSIIEEVFIDMKNKKAE